MTTPSKASYDDLSKSLSDYNKLIRKVEAIIRNQQHGLIKLELIFYRENYLNNLIANRKIVQDEINRRADLIDRDLLDRDLLLTLS